MRNYFTKEEVQFIRDNLDKGNIELATILGKTPESINGVMKRYKIRRSSEQLYVLRGLHKKNNTYDLKLDFAKSMGFKNLCEAISGLGKYEFECKFKERLQHA